MLRSSVIRVVAASGVARRGVATSGAARSQELFDAMKRIVPEKAKEVAAIRKNHGDIVLGQVTVGMAYGGMRGIKGMTYETSALDANEGIRFRGLTIPECQQRLPAYKPGGEPMPEGLLWLLLTGEVPTKAQADSVTRSLREREAVPSAVLDVLARLPADTHPMTAFSIGILALQPQSKFAAAYARGVGKNTLWEYALDDTLDLVAKAPIVAAAVFNNAYFGGRAIAPKKDADWSGNFAHMLGFQNGEFDELMRLYLTIHSDHEGGNVSAHATKLVGSALSDPFLSYSAGLNGLAGPLHGLANQEVLRFLYKIIDDLGAGWEKCTEEQLTKAVWDHLNAGQVVPGYGHAVLRKTDPRYTCQREFALKYLPQNPMFGLVSKLYKLVPGILTEHGKTANPWPNVDAHSGVLLQHYGLTQENYYTVLFGVSRALGALSGLVWDRAFGLPIERPKSLTTEFIKSLIK